MLNFFKTETIYIRLFSNKIEIRNIQRGVSISKVSEEAFSNERLLLANIDVAIRFAVDILNEIQGNNIFKANLKVLLQPMEKIEGGISQVEHMVFNDFISQIGGKYCFIHPTKEYLTDDKVTELTSR